MCIRDRNTSSPSTTTPVTAAARASDRRSARSTGLPDNRSARSCRTRAAFATIREEATTTICRMDRAAAACRSSSCVVWYQISVSILSLIHISFFIGRHGTSSFGTHSGNIAQTNHSQIDLCKGHKTTITLVWIWPLT